MAYICIARISSYLQGIEQVKNEVEDPSEALIDGTYGHGR